MNQIGNTFLVSLTSGSSISIQALSNFVPANTVTSGFGTIKPSATLTIIRIA